MSAVRAALIAGGASRRMGTDKASLRLQGETLLERTARIAERCGLPLVVVGRGRPDGWHGPACAFIPDATADCGPLGGIFSALIHAAGDAALCLPCDMPALTAEALAWLVTRWRSHGRTHGTVARRAGHLEPLFAVYAPAALPNLRAALAAGDYSCWRAIAKGDYDLCPVPDAHLPALRDCDTPGDWHAVAGDA
jgi:molybdopterin-guanine dinucleotide biosynthesis protein A